LKVSLELERYVGAFFPLPSAVALITTVSPSGVVNVAPKTQVMPVGRHNYWGFACCKQHHTYTNVVEQGEFVVNMPGLELIGKISDASQEFPEGTDELAAIGLCRFPSLQVRVPSITECGVHIECVRHTVLDAFGGDSLIIGRVVAARVDSELMLAPQHTMSKKPLLVYVHPNHYTIIRDFAPFAFPPNYKP